MIKIGSSSTSLPIIRRLSEAGDAVQTASERLSSGMRINHAKDDAAGLSVATSLKSRSIVYQQGVRNLNDGISYLSVADGALQQLSSITIRQKELAEQSANGVYSATQRAAINNEATALTSEFNRIVGSTTFNGVAVLDVSQNTSQQLQLQAGYGSGGTLTYSVGTQLDHSAGNGTFSATTSTYTMSYGTSDIHTADFNNDGILDIVSTDGSNKVSVRLGLGNGSFAAEQSINVANGAVNISIGDFNNDGFADLLVTAGSSATGASVLIGNGTGGFASAVTYSTTTGPYYSAIGDLNGDGNLDFATSDTSGLISVHYGNGNGTFGAIKTYSIFGTVPEQIAIADVNGDGLNDLIVAEDTGGIRVSLNQGGGSFTSSTSYSVGAGGGVAVQVADFNGDGKLDIATTSYGGGYVAILKNNGNGTFGSLATFAAVANAINLAAQDVNGDGVTDLVVIGGATSNYSAVLLNNGTGSFTKGQTFAELDYQAGVALADVTGDGVADILDAGSGGIRIRSGIGTLVSTASKVDLSTQSGAKAALTILDSQLNRISAERGQIGAAQSRTEIAINTLRAQSDNYEQAYSRIMDADVAQEAANLVRSQVLQQAAAAVLAQANQQPQVALTLLRPK